MIVENEENDKHQDTQGYRRQDVVWGGVDIKKQAYTPAKCTNLLAYIKPFVSL